MASFTPPDISAAFCENVPFESASDTAIDNKAAFDAFDQTPEAKTIRVDRHAPLKAVTYTIADRRARCIKGPVDVTSEELVKYLARPFFCPCSQPEDIWHTSSPRPNI